jgi:hypothetical protein
VKVYEDEDEEIFHYRTPYGISVAVYNKEK